MIKVIFISSEIVPDTDVKGSLDHPLFTRMPRYYISDYEIREFDKFTSSYLSGQDENWEGKVTRLAYYIKTGAKQASMLQIARNYETKPIIRVFPYWVQG